MTVSPAVLSVIRTVTFASQSPASAFPVNRRFSSSAFLTTLFLLSSMRCS